MRKVWIVVANSSNAVVYRAENVNKLTPLKTFDHSESHLPGRDLEADRQGRETNRVGWGSNTIEEKMPAKVKEANYFADQICAFLEKGYHAGEVERIYLVANPAFLGILRQQLNPLVAKLIETEIGKDLTQSKPEQIREYLPPVL